jgi:DNA-directed RNA polymerase beta' subunit
MIVDNQYYKCYPDFKEEDIGTETSNMFVDTLVMSNLYLKGLGADFDGDTASVKGVFTDEANAELRKFINDKKNFVGFNSGNIRVVDADIVQSLYNLTKVLPQDEKTLTKSISYK